MRFTILLVLTAWALANFAMAEPTITYQGQLQSSGGPVSGDFDLEFRLFDAQEDGNQIGNTLARPQWPVADGLFQVELDFPAAAFDGSQRWLEVEVAGQILTPRQAVTSAPMAIRALSVSAENLAGDFWRRGGNAGTDPASGDVLGTTDNAPLEIHVDNQRAIRLEPGDVPNVIGGSEANAVATGRIGATVGGGGCPTGVCDPTLDLPNVVTEDFGTIGGGLANVASGSVATVGGGWENTASGANAIVGGGLRNSATSSNSTVGGGISNSATGSGTTVGGGTGNSASVLRATVGGGGNNTAGSRAATVAGGDDNIASGIEATVGGGRNNEASGIGATVPGGGFNLASGQISFAAGARAKALHDRTFVWSDDVEADFSSTGDQQFLVRAGGGLGINTNSPTAALTVRASTDQLAPLRLQDLEGNNVMIVLANGRTQFAEQVRIGEFASASSLTVCRSSQGVLATCTSSARYKNNVVPLESAVDLVAQLEPVRYRWKNSGEADIGLIAEQVAEVVPEMVRKDDDGKIVSFEHNRLGPLLVGAFQEQSAITEQRFATVETSQGELLDRISMLETENAELRQLAERNAELEARLATLEAVIVGDRQLSAGKTSSGAPR